MGKRSAFERRPKDFYPTPYEAVIPLLSHLVDGTRFTEPCAGEGDLIRHLERAGHVCIDAFDDEEDARTTTRLGGTCYITNPPWDRKILHPIIENLSSIAPTWLLFDADWMHTKQARIFIPRLREIVSVGRVKWIPDSKMTGKDNCCWYLFGEPTGEQPRFYERQDRTTPIP